MGKLFTTVHTDEEDHTLMTFFVWSEEDVHKVQVRLVEDALSKLADSRTRPTQKRQLLNWCLGDELSPFGFSHCCKVQSIDASAIQNLLSYRFRAELRPKYCKEGTNAKIPN